MDASIVKADASRQRHHEDDDDWGSGGGTRAVREYLEGLEEGEPPLDKAARRVSPPTRVPVIRQRRVDRHFMPIRPTI